MHSFKSVNQIQIDLTTYCNASCGCCVRNQAGGPLNDRLKLQHFKPNMWFKMCSDGSLENIELFVFNGNYGDPLMHPMIYEFVEHLYKVNPNMTIAIHTNGGIRDADFWNKFALLLSKFANHVVYFGIDGLEDTSPLYRRGVDYNKVMENAQAFIEFGGFAAWRYIVFDHNKHQVEQASNRAKQMGFSCFSLNRATKTEFEVVEYKTYPAGKYTAPDRDYVQSLKEKYDFGIKGFARDYVDSSCPWVATRKIQIDPTGGVWPCCYFSLDVFAPNLRKEYLRPMMKFNNLEVNNLKQILNNDYWQKDLPQAWNENTISRCNKCQGLTTV